jgi:hypothetical protein
MTFWLVAIAIILVLILAALERGNSIKSAQVEVERDRLEVENERHETERLDAEEQREHDTFFAANGYPPAFFSILAQESLGGRVRLETSCSR